MPDQTSVTKSLTSTASALVAPGRGILAADETVATLTERFEVLGIDSTPETRRQYRELLLSAPGIDDHISAVILHDETIRQDTSTGVSFPQLLAARGIVAGIKIDCGSTPLALAAGEVVTEGIDGLGQRAQEYHRMGAEFAKWRAILTIADRLPSPYCVTANANVLARYAAVCQEEGLVPIVESKILRDGDHDLDRCEAVTRQVLTELFGQLRMAGVDLAAVVLECSMVAAGTKSASATLNDVAAATIACLRDVVPPEVPGIAFLAGGQRPSQATAHLDAIVRLGPHPWALTFSFGRALQMDTLHSWGGDADNANRAQEVLRARTASNSQAALGRYAGSGAAQGN